MDPSPRSTTKPSASGSPSLGRYKLNDEGTNPLSELMKARRPSLATSESYHRTRMTTFPETNETPDLQTKTTVGLSESPPEGRGFRSSWEINVKGLVGDAVGNMSISPTSRDIVLAARRGLFIIDLESPFSIPRFLPQGGTWDVADVQWNPHPTHAQYIVSTSSEKLLIWNLRLGGKTSIEHILRSHYRAITDINWHTSECDIVASTGIDSWIWAWDLRTPQRPIFGLSAFKSGGTQVKWNRKDGNLLASAHSNEVLIWDRRKGSLPIIQIQAHTSKIYGIDWSRRTRSELVTCSLDKTIKTWDIDNPDLAGNAEPQSCIRTNYPVWRARNLPFGDGILSLPQRSETTLEMFARSEGQTTLVETFEGHSDVVKEFVWRKGSQGDYQLITWSKDRTLRFWPIDAEVMQKVGQATEVVRGRSKLPRSDFAAADTFTHAPEEGHDPLPLLSAPMGNRGILAEVRAPLPPRYASSANLAYGFSAPPHLELFQRLPSPLLGDDATPTVTNTRPLAMAIVQPTAGGTMSKAGMGAKSVAQVDQLAWLASVRVGSKRGSSSGENSRPGSELSSRINSMSRPPSGPDYGVGDIGARQRSGSLNRGGEERKDGGDTNHSLQDEITTVLTKLAASKIKLEKHDVSKKRFCTLGLQGPWGETSSVFMRVTFTFPREYPQASFPQGTPTVELERNPLISIRDRAYILKRLRRIRERKRPCLEACLRFLLFGDDGRNEPEDDLVSSSDEDDEPAGKKAKEITVSLLRNAKNLAEPRTSQGAFGPNGELICFFRAAPRIMRNVPRGLGETSANEDAAPTPPSVRDLPQQQQQPSYFQSPALVSDAVRRLGLAAMDRTVPAIDPKHPERGSTILRAMTNLLTMPHHRFQHRGRGDSESKSLDETNKNFALVPSRRSAVFLMTTNSIAGADRKVAVDYVFRAGSLAEVCEKNAEAARRHGRYDHERVFRTLRTLYHEPRDKNSQEPDEAKDWSMVFVSDSLAAQIIKRLYSDLAKEKDIQMLAMISMLALQTLNHIPVTAQSHTTLPPKKKDIPTTVSIPKIPVRTGSMDYFSVAKAMNANSTPTWSIRSTSSASPVVPTQLAPPTPLSSSNSSRGSWSSLFNTGSMRQFMHGVQDTFKDGLTTPTEITPTATAIPVAASRSGGARGVDAVAVAKRRKLMREDSMQSNSSGKVSRSWNEGVAASGHSARSLTLSFSSTGHGGRASLKLLETNLFVDEKRAVIFEPPAYEERAKPLFGEQLVAQFRMNVYAYAELLFRWQLYQKRLELLKATLPAHASNPPNTKTHGIGVVRLCPRTDCRSPLPDKVHVCRHCGITSSMPACTICRLPVKGLSRTCLSCCHVTHISCWNSWDVAASLCPSGCGCFCTGSDGPFTRPSTRLGLTPPAYHALLAPELT